MPNKRAPVETLAALLELLQNETPDDRGRLIGAAIVWFELGGALADFGLETPSERGDDGDG